MIYTKHITKVSEDIKIRVIFTIDNLKPHFGGTIYYRELNSLRRKYIYKDISFDELVKDVDWIKNLKKLIKSP